MLASEHLSSRIYLIAVQTRNQPFCCLKVNTVFLRQVLVPLDLASWVDSELVCLVCHLYALSPAGGAVLFPMRTRHTPKSTPDMTVKVPTVPTPHIVRVVRGQTDTCHLATNGVPLFVADATRGAPEARTMSHTPPSLFRVSLRAFHALNPNITALIVAPAARSTPIDPLSIATSHSPRFPRNHTLPHTLPMPSRCFRSRQTRARPRHRFSTVLGNTTISPMTIFGSDLRRPAMGRVRVLVKPPRLCSLHPDSAVFLLA